MSRSMLRAIAVPVRRSRTGASRKSFPARSRGRLALTGANLDENKIGRHLRRPVCYAREDTRGRAASLADRRLRRSRPRGTPVAPGCRRLIGDASVISAIRRAAVGFPAAEIEIRLPRVADGPVALLGIELEQGAALPDRDDVFDIFRLRCHVV